MPAVGLPADAPERPAAPAAYPAVHDIPPPRNSVTLTNTEASSSLKHDLVTARDQQQSGVGIKPPNRRRRTEGRRPRSSRSPAAASIY